MTEEEISKAKKLAERTIQIAQNTLLLHLQFMSSAIFRLSLKQEDTSIATDGRYLFYGVGYVLRRYRQEPKQLTRDILHMVLHCIFRHTFVKPPIDVDYWDLAADIAVENLINSLTISCVDTERVSKQRQILEDLQDSITLMNAEHIYRYYKNKGLSKAQLLSIRAIFISDDHSIWYMSQEGRGRQETDNDSSDETPKYKNLTDDKTACEWEKASVQIQMDLDSFSKDIGNRAGGMVQQLQVLNREKYDYSSFLKRFAVMEEAMKINDDEFDYIFYTYGLKLFGNIPLIEPLEYKDVKHVREFVVAIDTSGSTRGVLVQRFLEKTYNILKSTESFSSKINLHIIQCDWEIQEHVKITNQEELDEYMSQFVIKGLGGTSFLPVFDEVDKLIASGEFQNLKGLIYFTDGEGFFPQRKPCYEVAFVFIQDEYGYFYDDKEIPPWAIKLILDEGEI